MADREGDEHAERERSEQREADQLAQVGGDRVARLLAGLLEVEAAAVGDTGDDAAIDGPQVDVEADRQADGVVEPDAPVDERDVEVERAARAGVGRQLDVADRELCLLVVGVEGGVGAEEAGGDHGRDDRGVTGDQEEPAATEPSSRLSLENAHRRVFGRSVLRG